MVAVGTIVWLSSELMFFAGLFAMYFTLRAVAGGDHWPPAPVRGDVYKMRTWMFITFLMGLTFVLGQANEYRMQYDENMTIHRDGYGSVFYLTTGFHGLHVIGGLVAFVFLLIRSTVGTFTPERATTAIVVSYYWHFVDVVWVALFAAIYLIQ